MPTPMDAEDFNHLMAEFEDDIQSISETLFLAKEGDLSKKDAQKAVAAAQAKILAYEALLKDDRFNDLRRSKIIQRFGESIDDIRGNLDTIAQEAE